jgi:hypothetical protein
MATIAIALAARYQRWDVALLAIATSRLLLDAGIFPYYDVELVLATLCVDVAYVARPHRSRWAAFAPVTLTASSLLLVARLPMPAEAVLATRVTVLLVAWLLTTARRPTGTTPAAESSGPETPSERVVVAVS